MKTPEHAWVITESWTDGDERRVCIVGPAGAKRTGKEIEHDPQAREFQMFDDDDILCYQGYYLGPDDERMFSPLDDFGTPNAGCTSIEYWDPYNKEWNLL